VNALTWQGVRRVRLDGVPDPRLQHDRDAIVEVELGSVCGSDLHVYHGREVGLDPGTIMGHEFVGRVIEAGAGVTNLSRGDRVASPFSTCCGRCYYCTRGMSARCVEGHLYGWVQGGVGVNGAQAERVRVPLADSTLLRLPDDVSPEAALLLCDVLPTGHYCATMAEVTAAGTYVVLGCGPVGLMAVLAARELGARDLYAVDSVAERLALAARFGATPVDARREDPVAVLRAATDGRGADAVLEAVGSPAAGRLAFELVRPGGILSAVGVHHESTFPFSPAQAYDHNLTYRIGRCPARSLMEGLIPLARRRRDELSAVLTHRLPLERGVEAYELFDAKRDGCIKIALEMR
jgi:threonine dehydrogenase-like Zn-dependent dehydrogenase